MGPPKYGYFIEPAVLVSRVDPVYPEITRVERVQGIVLVHVHVDAEGKVQKAEVVSGDPLLARAALDAVQQWRYKPVIHGGVAVEVERSAKVVFALR